MEYMIRSKDGILSIDKTQEYFLKLLINFIFAMKKLLRVIKDS